MQPITGLFSGSHLLLAVCQCCPPTATFHAVVTSLCCVPLWQNEVGGVWAGGRFPWSQKSCMAPPGAAQDWMWEEIFALPVCLGKSVGALCFCGRMSAMYAASRSLIRTH